MRSGASSGLRSPRGAGAGRAPAPPRWGPYPPGGLRFQSAGGEAPSARLRSPVVRARTSLVAGGAPRRASRNRAPGARPGRSLSGPVPARAGLRSARGHSPLEGQRRPLFRLALGCPVLAPTVFTRLVGPAVSGGPRQVGLGGAKRIRPLERDPVAAGPDRIRPPSVVRPGAGIGPCAATPGSGSGCPVGSEPRAGACPQNRRVPPAPKLGRGGTQGRAVAARALRPGPSGRRRRSEGDDHFS